MHSYSIDKKIRSHVTLAVFIISILITMFCRSVFTGPLDNITNWLLTTFLKPVVEFLILTGFFPSVLEVSFIYGVLSWCYEKYIWKWPIIMRIHGVPNINGKWVGKLVSSYDGKAIGMEMNVEQTWSEISFKSKFLESDSSSNTATIHLNSNRGICIYFGFHNESSDVNTGMQSYDGYNILTMKDNDHISARYFNDRPNPDKRVKGGNKGKFDLTRQPE